MAVTSTRRTTSTDNLRRLVLGGVFALAAAGVCFGSGRQAYAALAGDHGGQTLELAQAMPRGADRDALLHRAQADLSGSLAVVPANAQAWLDLAKVRHLQAVGAEVDEVSPTLAAAAMVAAERAMALRPAWPEPPARLAQARALTGAQPDAIAEPLRASYRLAAFDESLLEWRPALAFSVWSVLGLETQASALVEACAYVRSGDGRHEALAQEAARTRDRVAADAMRSVVTDVACWRAPEAQP